MTERSMAPSTGRPLIGITLDSEEPGGYSRFPWYALRQNYADAVLAAGGLPVALPHEPDLVDSYLDRIDGLILTGGAFDVDPRLYGDASVHATVKTKDRRTRFEWSVTQGALDRDMPVFGICGGQQLLAVVLGGTLIQHIPDEIENALAHEQPNPRDEPGHMVAITAGSRLRDIVGTDELPVNSAHHQAARSVAGGTIVDAIAPDGVIEGIEHPDYRFCIGVQWHPEFFISDGDRRLFDSFIAACR